ncbi:S9 family peptidase [Sanyastnella coralliicola]|uniref:S9 family peptidase n=1 Tax=Sanyastnella coralliicola TaxID=3069118 RepID=UPI0027B8DB1E|nr:DPP IV N-terminal domain-containing protein [Longitalea sp. SCSIO 12813]
MKKLLLFVALCLSFTAFSQTLSVEEAVMERWTTFYPENLSQLQWVKGTDNYAFAKDDQLKIYNMRGRIVGAITLEQINKHPDLKLESLPRFKFTSSNTAEFSSADKNYTVDVKSGKVASAGEKGKPMANEEKASNGNTAFTKENNVFVNTPGKVTQVTDHPEGIVAGQAIARFEFGIGKGLFWSPSGERLAFYEKDERNVTEYPLVDMNATPAELNAIRYPMAGSSSEHAACGIYDVRSDKTVYLNVNGGVRDDSYYITNLAWTPDNQSVIAAIVNRDQNVSRVVKFNASTGEVDRILFTESDDKYIEPEQPVMFIPDGSGDFIWFSERDGFNNIYRYGADGKLRGRTEATFPITELVTFSPKGKFAVVHAHGPNPTETHAYRVDLMTMQMSKITTQAGTHRVMVSGSGKFIIDTWSSVDTPRKIELKSVSGKASRVLLDAADPMANRAIGKTELLTIKANDGTDLHARLITPPNMDMNKKYPVVVYVYNGPHVQLVTNSYMAGAPLWMHSLAGDGYIVFTVDGRGSANRGKDFEQAVFRQLGNQEMEDQLAGVNYLKSLRFVDSERMAVHGWSFGGFMTTSLMLRQPGTFKVGVAGGPVIDWTLYEVMYTERYMDTPKQNPEGFEESNLTNYVSNLEGDLLMIHGTIDDVVVMQHNMRFLKACVDEGVQVDFFVYPGHPHNVRGKDRVHLMTKVIDYIKANL